MNKFWIIFLTFLGLTVLMPVGLVDLAFGGEVAPFKNFVVPALLQSWRSHENRAWVRKVPQPWRFLVKLVYTIVALSLFWVILLWGLVKSSWSSLKGAGNVGPEVVSRWKSKQWGLNKMADFGLSAARIQKLKVKLFEVGVTAKSWPRSVGGYLDYQHGRLYDQILEIFRSEVFEDAMDTLGDESEGQQTPRARGEPDPVDEISPIEIY